MAIIHVHIYFDTFFKYVVVVVVVVSVLLLSNSIHGLSRAISMERLADRYCCADEQAKSSQTYNNNNLSTWSIGVVFMQRLFNLYGIRCLFCESPGTNRVFFSEFTECLIFFHKFETY